MAMGPSVFLSYRRDASSGSAPATARVGVGVGVGEAEVGVADGVAFGVAALEQAVAIAMIPTDRAPVRV